MTSSAILRAMARVVALTAASVAVSVMLLVSTASAQLFLLGMAIALGAGVATGILPGVDNEAELARLRAEPCYREFEAMPRIPENQPGWNKTICIWETYGQRLLKDYYRLAHYERAFRLMKNEGGAEEARAAQDFLKLQMYYMPYRGQPLDAGGAGGWARLYVCRIQTFVSRAGFQAHVDEVGKIEKRLEQYEKDANQFLATLNERGAAALGSTSVQDYAVFQAPNRDLLVGQQESLAKLRKCDLKGWGLGCEPVGAATLALVGGKQFDTLEAAKAFFCEHMRADTLRVVPLTGGRDREAKFTPPFPDQYLGVSNAPACTGNASGQTAALPGATSWPIPECGPTK